MRTRVSGNLRLAHTASEEDGKREQGGRMAGHDQRKAGWGEGRGRKEENHRKMYVH